jgi:hypothetical protein
MQTPRLSRLALALFAALSLLALSATSALADPPENDNFADAKVLSSLNGTAFIMDSTVGGSFEPGEHAQSGSGVTASIWYRYTAFKNGTARVTGCDTYPAGETISVYTGATLGTLTSVAAGKNNCPYGGGATTGKFAVAAGTTYWIQFASTSGGDLRAGVDFSTTGAAPANDNFANAKTLSGGLPIVVDASNFMATGESGEPFNGDGPDNSLWFKYTIPSDGLYAFDTCGSPDEGQDTVVSIYTAPSASPAMADLNASTYSDDACDGTDNSRLSDARAELTSGTTVWIQVANYAEWYGSHVSLRVHRVTSPENNGALPIVTPYPTKYKPGNSIFADVGGWNAADNYEFQWKRCDAAGENCVDIASADSPGYTVQAEDVGHVLRVLITGVNSSGSTSQLSKPSQVVDDTPPNDNLADAIDLGNSATVVRNDDNYFATYEGDDEPDINGDFRSSTVWYTWTAPDTATYQLSTCGGPENGVNGPYIDVFTSPSDPAGPTTVAIASFQTGYCDGNFGIGHEADLHATSGTKYWIGVGSNGGEHTAFHLTIDPVGSPVFTAAPSINGTVTAGQTITASPGVVSPSGSFYTGWYLCDRNHQNCEDAHSAGYAFFIDDVAAAHGSVKFVIEANNLAGTASASAFIDTPEPVDGGGGGGSGGSDSTPPPPAKPADPLKLKAPSSLGSFKAGKKGVLTFKKLTLDCGAGATGACTGAAKLVAKVKGRKVTLGTSKININAGGSAALKLKLSKSGLKALKKAKKLKATLTVSATAPGHAAQSSTASLTLKP